MGRTIVNVGVVEGGAKRNMRADTCRVEVDVRLPVGATVRGAVERLEALAGEHAGRLELAGCSEPNVTAPGDPLVRTLIRHAERVTGTAPLPTRGLGCTDARLWRARGLPAAVYGPGPAGMGAPDEALSIDELRTMARVHALAAHEILCGDGE